MSKERLEEIKNRRKQYNPALLPVWFKDMDWLIEQAERVQELEESNRNMEYNIQHVINKNMRCRKAIEIVLYSGVKPPEAEQTLLNVLEEVKK